MAPSLRTSADSSIRLGVFACGWQYGIAWLCVLPLEISAASNVSMSVGIHGARLT